MKIGVEVKKYLTLLQCIHVYTLRMESVFEFFVLLLQLFMSRIWTHNKRQTNRHVKTLKMPNRPGNLKKHRQRHRKTRKMLYELGI